MSRTRQLTAITMVAVVVLASGCAGFGTDGPADGDGEADADNGSGDLEGSDDTQDGQDDRPNGGDGASDGGADDGSDGGGDSDGAPSGSDSDSKSGSDADADTGSESKADDGTKDGNESKDSDSGGAMDGSSGDGDGDAGDENSGDGDGEGVSSDDDTDPSDSGDGDDDDRNGGDDEAPYSTLTVTVENDGEPVEGVEVVGIGPGGEIYSSVTDGNGQATFDLGDGAYTWYASTDGTEYDESSEEEITMDGEDRSIVLTVQSDEPDPTETHTLTVTVTDPDGEPVTDETVHIVTYNGGADVASGTTDENGTVQFDLENGDYEVAVSAPDRDLYQPSDQRLVTIDGEDEEFDVQLESPGDNGDESDTATGIVRVVNQDGEPVEGEPVILTPPGVVDDENKEERETNADGEVIIELAAGEPDDVVMYGIEVRDQEDTLGIMADEHHGVQEVAFEVDTSDDDTETHALTIANAGDSTVEIVPEDGQHDGEPITVDPSDGVAEADVEPGRYSIGTDERWGAEINVTEDTEVLLQDDDPEPITVEVVDSETGEPVEGAEFSGVCNWYYTAGDALVTGESDADGFAELQAEAAPTTCETNVNADGYEETGVEISVPDDDGRTIELEPKSQMTQFETTIVVENEQGEPIEGKVVEARTPPGDGEWEEIGTTNENGEVVLTGQSSDPTDVIQFEVRVQGHEEKVVQTYVDDSEHEEMIVIEADGGNNGDYDTCDDFESHAEAQSYFEEDPRDSERSARDGDNDGVACETLADDPDDAKAIVIVEDQDGNPVEGVTVGIGDDTAVTNEGGVASVGYDDFDDPDEQRTLDVAVLEQKTQMTIEPGEHNDPLQERSNIEEITVESAASQGSLTTVAA